MDIPHRLVGRSSRRHCVTVARTAIPEAAINLGISSRCPLLNSGAHHWRRYIFKIEAEDEVPVMNVFINYMELLSAPGKHLYLYHQANRGCVEVPGQMRTHVSRV